MGAIEEQISDSDKTLPTKIDIKDFDETSSVDKNFTDNCSNIDKSESCSSGYNGDGKSLAETIVISDPVELKSDQSLSSHSDDATNSSSNSGGATSGTSSSRLSFPQSLSSFFKIASERWLGLFLAAGSGLLLTFYSTLYKIIKKEIDNSTILMLRGVIQVFIMAVVISFQNISVRPKSMKDKTSIQKLKIWLIFSSVFAIGGFRLCFIFAALERIPMALVHTILNGSPVFVMMLSHFFLKDSCNPLRFVSTFGLIAGVILIFQPYTLINQANQIPSLNNTALINSSELYSTEDDEASAEQLIDFHERADDLVGYLFSIGALVLSSFGSVLTKKLTDTFDKSAIALYLGFSIGLVGGLQLAIFGNKAPVLPTDYYPWLVGAVVGLLGVGQQFCLIAALKLESPTRVTVVRSLQIVISFVVQVQALREHPGVDQIFGAFVVLFAIMLVTLEYPINSRLENCKPCKKEVTEKAQLPEENIVKVA